MQSCQNNDDFDLLKKQMDDLQREVAWLKKQPSQKCNDQSLFFKQGHLIENKAANAKVSNNRQKK